MKIRTDFVTNSSSSSFSIVLYVETAKGDTISFEESPFEYNGDDDGTVYFDTDLSELLDGETRNIKAKYSKIEELAKYLMESVSDDYDEEYADNDDFEEEIAERKDEFINQLTKSVSDISDILKISVCRDYSAEGEFADLIADNDKQLCVLAEKVNTTIGEEQKIALEELRNYINTSNGERQGENFGCGFDDFRYNWNGDDKALIELAKRLCSGYAPNSCEGSEYQELDLASGIFSKYAEFELS